MASFETVLEPDDAGLGDDGGCPLRKKSILRDANPGPVSGRWSTLSMALGYLGLVTILSMAPFLQQAITPHHQQPMVCTDFGGSR